MKHRIGLVSSKGFGRSTTTYVEVADVAALAAVLKKNNAGRAILYWRDRFGDGQTEGKEFAPEALSERHFQWLCAVQKDGMRGLFYDRSA